MTDGCMRRLKFLHEVTELFTPSTPSLAAWFGLQFIESACNNEIEISKSTAQTLCPRCGVINIPGLTRSSSFNQQLRPGKNIVQVCCHCQYGFAAMSQDSNIKLCRPKLDLKSTSNSSSSFKPPVNTSTDSSTKGKRGTKKHADDLTPAKRPNLMKKKTTLSKILSLQKQNEKKATKPFTLSDFLSNI